MACIDYPDVKCAICGLHWTDGYIVVKGKVICEDCIEKIKEAEK
jgi:hypothetical protein